MPLILLKSGDLLGIGRPAQNGFVAAFPSGIIGGIPKILDPIRGQGSFLLRSPLP